LRLAIEHSIMTAMDERKQRAKKIALTALAITLMAMAFVVGNLRDKPGYAIGLAIAAAATNLVVAFLVKLSRSDA
jgi:hypothetical protein